MQRDDENDLPRKRKSFLPEAPKLELLSLEELREYKDWLTAQDAEADEAIKVKQDAAQLAQAFFKS